MLDSWFEPSPEGQGSADTPGGDGYRQGNATAGDAPRSSRALEESLPRRTGPSTRTSRPAPRSSGLATKYVVSRTLTDPGWQNSTVLAGDAPLEEVRALNSGDG